MPAFAGVSWDTGVASDSSGSSALRFLEVDVGATGGDPEDADPPRGPWMHLHYRSPLTLWIPSVLATPSFAWPRLLRVVRMKLLVFIDRTFYYCCDLQIVRGLLHDLQHALIKMGHRPFFFH